ncbi:MAG: YdcF family protein [Anaerolineales bacterium]|uniref:YdcF family protein n=1 Tax=Promineifilum sp. TaxID=2664178 RepID=UPI001E043128|nr:YdcF family protein [Anaerolineales bacterium]MCB8936200.1 YdcF family protein [Promineifilum sp.]MCO5178660.1 YdcF family protein [Promineifilum sp.]
MSPECTQFVILPPMFVFLSKFLPLFIFPLGFIALLLIVALVWRRGSRWMIVMALILLWLGSSRYVAYALVRSLETRYPAVIGAPSVDAIVVLGGGTRGSDPPRPLPEVNEAGDRIIYGAKLYHEGAAAIVLVTGGSIDWMTPEGIEPEANDMSVLMKLLGVAPEALWLETESRNTYENAFYSRQMLAERGYDTILLVTSAMHMPRAVPLFEAQGLIVIPAPTDFLVSNAEWSHLWHGGPTVTLINLLPNVEYLTYTTRVMKEYIGLFIYDLRGWL